MKITYEDVTIEDVSVLEAVAILDKIKTGNKKEYLPTIEKPKRKRRSTINRKKWTENEVKVLLSHLGEGAINIHRYLPTRTYKAVASVVPALKSGKNLTPSVIKHVKRLQELGYPMPVQLNDKWRV